MKKAALVLSASALAIYGFSHVASSRDNAIDKQAIERAVARYSRCQADCASELAGAILKEGAKSALKTAAIMKAKPTSTTLGVLAFAVFASELFDSGAKVVDGNAACYQTCDALNKEVVLLGRKGALGPLIKGDDLNPDVLNNKDVIDAFTKFVRPIPLPAEERSSKFGAFVASLS